MSTLPPLASLLLAPHVAELTLHSQIDYQVVQRSNPGMGLLHIQGELSEEVAARWRSSDGTKAKP